MSAGMNALFDPKPEKWGLRGDPHVWSRMRDLLAELDQPAAVGEGTRLLHDAFRAIVGVDVHHEGEDRVFRPEFDTGGMSGGWVDLRAWRDQLMPLLESRLVASAENL